MCCSIFSLFSTVLWILFFFLSLFSLGHCIGCPTSVTCCWWPFWYLHTFLQYFWLYLQHFFFLFKAILWTKKYCIHLIPMKCYEWPMKGYRTNVNTEGCWSKWTRIKIKSKLILKSKHSVIAMPLNFYIVSFNSGQYNLKWM